MRGYREVTLPISGVNMHGWGYGGEGVLVDVLHSKGVRKLFFNLSLSKAQPNIEIIPISRHGGRNLFWKSPTSQEPEMMLLKISWKVTH